MFVHFKNISIQESYTERSGAIEEEEKKLATRLAVKVHNFCVFFFCRHEESCIINITSCLCLGLKRI